MTTTDLAIRHRRKPSKKRQVAQQRAIGNVARRSTLPEYLEQEQVEALIQAAPNGQARLILLEQWRAGLRVSEAVALEVADLSTRPCPRPTATSCKNSITKRQGSWL